MEPFPDDSSRLPPIFNMPKAANQRSRRSHRLGGCENCRKRHTRCDQVRPKCLTCLAVGLDCQGYNATVQWVTDDDGKNIAAEMKSGVRQHLYPENVRLSMTSQLLGQVEPDSLDESLAEIDQWNNTGQSPVRGKSVGPFGVMSFSAVPPSTSLDPAQPVGSMDIAPQIIDTPSTSGLTASLPDYLQWSDIFDLDFEHWLSQQPDDFGLDSNGDVSQVNHIAPMLTSLPILADSTTNATIDDVDDQDLKQQASFLIKHYLDEVINSLAALPFHRKSPHKILHVSAAVQTHADLTYLGRQVKHANAANFFAILASSAYHLGSNPSSTSIQNSEYWMGLSNKAGLKAKDHLQKSLRFELSGEGKAKYKDQLMALLSTLIYSIMAGHQKDARCYMIDSERLLRLRGLAKKHISRRSRMLHHVYTWIRIVGESTYVLHDYKHTTAQPKLAVPDANYGHNDKLDDFLRIDQREGNDDMDMEDPKEPEIGRQDIHLEDPRNDPDSMYMHIYGLPEQWLSLLSQTARLANSSEIWKDKPDLQRSLERKAARLEDMICTFASSTAGQSNADILSPSQHMLQALKSSLIIYFYRRIRNVNPLILQTYVDAVIDALRQFDMSLAQHHIPGPGTAWPAFVAGCEASPGSRRDALLTWIETAFLKTGFSYYSIAKEVMQEVWLSRDQHVTSPRSTRSAKSAKSSSASTWTEISKQKQQWVIVC